MKNNQKIIINTLLSLFFYITAIAQINIQAPNYGWPVKTEENTNHRGYMTGTPGEYRTPYAGEGYIFGEYYPANQHRFHRGVDLVGDDGPSGLIYSIEPGSNTIELESSGYNRRARVNGTIYWHIVENVLPGTTVLENQQFAKMNGVAAHLHIQTPGTNYLIERLPTYQDNSPVQIVSYSFKQNGHNLFTNSTQLNATVLLNNESHKLIYGKVDIVIRSRDYRVNPDGNGNTGNLAPNQVGYNIINSDNETVDGEVFDVDFTTLPTQYASEYVFGYGTDCCDNVVFNYIATSHPRNMPYDRYFNTRIKSGVTETWNYDSNNPPNYIDTDYNTLIAPINEQAHYKDGKYSAILIVKDVDSDGVNSCNETQENVPILIDNFRPYIKDVLISAQNINIYHAYWEWNELTQQLEFKPNNNPALNAADPATDGTEDLFFYFQASEPLQSLSVSVFGQNYNVEVDPINQIYALVIPADEVPDNKSTYYLQFNGVDLANNKLLGFVNKGVGQNFYTAQQLPTRTGDNTWSSTFTGVVDNIHQFNICGGQGLLPNECTIASFTAKTNCSSINLQTDAICVNTPIKLEVSKLYNPTTINWQVSDNTTITLENEDANNYYYKVEFTNTGIKTLNLQIIFDNNYESWSFETISVAEAGNCIASINENITITTYPSNCGNNGAINISMPIGGTLPYTYNWTGANNYTNTEVLNQTTANIAALKSGDYYVTITDGKGCSTTKSANVGNYLIDILAPEAVCINNMTYLDFNNPDCKPYTYKIEGYEGYFTEYYFNYFDKIRTVPILFSPYYITVTNASGNTASFSGTGCAPECAKKAAGNYTPDAIYCSIAEDHLNEWGDVYLNIFDNDPPSSSFQFDVVAACSNCGLPVSTIKSNFKYGSSILYFYIVPGSPKCYYYGTFSPECSPLVGNINCNSIMIPEFGETGIGPQNCCNTKFSSCNFSNACIEYYVSDDNGINSVFALMPSATALNANVTHTVTSNQYGHQSGTFCWNNLPGGNYPITLYAKDGCENFSTHKVNLNIECGNSNNNCPMCLSNTCITGYYPVVKPATVGCNPSIVVSMGSISFVALPTGCADVISARLYGSTQTAVSTLNLPPGNHVLEIFVNNKYWRKGTFEIPSQEVESAQLQATMLCYKVTPTQQNGGEYAAKVEVTGGYPPYSYEWALSNGSPNCINEFSSSCNCFYQANLCGGVYEVSVTDLYGCKAFGKITLSKLSPCSSTSNLPALNGCVPSFVNVFPNPFTNTINVSFKITPGSSNANKKTDIVLNLINNQGIKIQEIFNGVLPMMQNYNQVINGSLLPPGVYYLQLKSCGNMAVKTIIKP